MLAPERLMSWTFRRFCGAAVNSYFGTVREIVRSVTLDLVAGLVE